MKSISSNLRIEIRDYLSDTFDIDRPDRRKDWAITADFPKKLIALIDWGKQPDDLFVSHLIDRCLNWGLYAQDDPRHPIIEYIKATESFGGGEHQLKMMEILETLRTELSEEQSQPDIKKALMPTPIDEILEKLIGESTLLPISFLEQGLHLSRSVAFVDAGLWSGSGFLISSNHLITNNHVIPDIATAKRAMFRFNYQTNLQTGIGPIEDYCMKEGGEYITNPDLDYSIIELENQPGSKWGVISYRAGAKIARGQRVNIIQHPLGRPKQISFRNNYVEYLDEKLLQYITHTEPGSSGSPVFNDLWELVGIHHAGGNLREPKTQRTYFRNEGVTIAAIIQDLPEKIKNQVSGS